MHCPVCRGPLATFECGGVELDACPSRCGTWFDEGEIELWDFGQPEAEPIGASTPGSRRCPRCRAALRVRRLGEGLEIDLCPRGDGVWFDRGEVARLAAVLGADPSPGNARLASAFVRLAQALEGTA